MSIKPYPFMVVAATGFVLSLLVHFCALMKLSWLLGPLGSAASLLHVGVFVVWLPAVLLSVRLMKGEYEKDVGTIIFRSCPNWMRASALFLVAYAAINFLIFLSQMPIERPPKLSSMPIMLRGFSGHWMVFYFVAFCIFHSGRRIEHTKNDDRQG